MRSSHRPARQSGFTLIEILVGCAISVVGLLVIFQTLAVWNKHSQTSMAGGDADTAGTLGMYNLERDLRLAGVGISTAEPILMGCPVSVTGGGVSSFPMTPVTINVGAASAPDSIDVFYGNSSFFTAGQEVISSTGTAEFLKRRNGFKQGDLAIVAGIAAGVPTCSLVEVTDTANADGFTVKHESGAIYASYYAASGAASAVAKFNPATAYPAVTSAMMFSLGPNPRLNRWEIGNGRLLQRTDGINGTPAMDVAEGVINLKAEYGVDANNDGKIDDATEWTATAPTDWTRLLAVRLAILVRSSQFERSPDAGASDATAVITAAAPTWAGGTFLMTNVDGTADSTTAGPDPNNWRYYRYRVYEKIVPLRNMIWN